MEFMYLVFTHMPGESYPRRIRSLLLYLYYVFQALINSPVLILWKEMMPERQTKTRQYWNALNLVFLFPSSKSVSNTMVQR